MVCTKLSFKLEDGGGHYLKTHGEQNEAIRKYLLGQLPQAELLQLEERLLAEDLCYEELLIAEDELVDRYLRDELSAQEKEGFEGHFLRTPGRQQKLRFARELKKYVAAEAARQSHEEPAPGELTADKVEVIEPRPGKWRLFSLLQIKSPVMGFALATAVLVILFGSAWVVVRNWSQRPQREPRDIITQVLTPGLSRDDLAGLKKFDIPAGKDTVRFQLELEANDYQVYRALLQDAVGTVILQQGGLKAQNVSGRFAVTVDVEASLLPAGYYQIKLKGTTARGNDENVASYHFAVSKKSPAGSMPDNSNDHLASALLHPILI